MMRWSSTMLVFYACVLSFLVGASGHPDVRIVDMTHTHDSDTIYWPGNPDNNFTILFRGMNTQLGFWYESNYFGTAEHGGTHLDAPSHFAEGTLRAQQIPLDKLAGPGVIIDVKNKVTANPDYRLTVQDLLDWEAKYGKIPYGAVVIMNSGWAVKYPNKTATFGSSTPTDPSTFHFPGFHEDAAQWLVNNREINVVGVDTPSMDYGQSTHFKVHQILAKENKSGVENVAYLDLVPEHGAMIYVASIKLYGGSGGPARVFATVMAENDTNSSGQHRFSLWSVVIATVLSNLV